MNHSINADRTLRWDRVRRAGMTLVELMVAIALSAMLLVSLVGVLSGIAKQGKVVDKLDQPVWPARFAKLVRRDLLAAESVWQSNGIVWMRTDAPVYESYRSTSRTNSSDVGVRRIGYQCVVSSDSPAILYRRDQERRCAMAIGPTRIVLERLDDQGTPQPLPSSPGPVPDQVRVWVWNDPAVSPVLVRDLVVR